MIDVGHALMHFFGLDDLSGSFYGFWSGIGSDLGELAIIGAAIGLYRKHTCHVDRCWRWARHPVNGTPYTVCRRHHPAIPDVVSHEDIVVAHQIAEGVCTPTAEGLSDSRSNSAD